MLEKTRSKKQRRPPQRRYHDIMPLLAARLGRGPNAPICIQKAAIGEHLWGAGESSASVGAISR
jgi:hypothetical protein